MSSSEGVRLSFPPSFRFLSLLLSSSFPDCPPLCRYFGRGISGEAQRGWEQRVYEATERMWADTKGETYQATQIECVSLLPSLSSFPSSRPADVGMRSLGLTDLARRSDKFVLLTGTGEIVLILIGSEECDEVGRECVWLERGKEDQTLIRGSLWPR